MQIRLDDKEKMYFSELLREEDALCVISCTECDLYKVVYAEYCALKLKDNLAPSKSFYIIVDKTNINNGYLVTVGYFETAVKSADMFDRTVVVHSLKFVTDAFGSVNANLITKTIYKWASSNKAFKNTRSIEIHYPVFEMDNSKILPSSAMNTNSMLLMYEQPDYVDSDIINFNNDKRKMYESFFEMSDVSAQKIKTMKDTTLFRLYELTKLLRPFRYLPRYEQLCINGETDIKKNVVAVLSSVYASVLRDKTCDVIMLFSKVSSELVGLVAYKLTDDYFKLIDITMKFMDERDVVPCVINTITDQLKMLSCDKYYIDTKPENFLHLRNTGYRPKDIIFKEQLRGILRNDNSKVHNK